MKKILAVIGAIVPTMMLAGCLPTGTTSTDQSSAGGGGTLFIYLGVMVLFFGAMYFIAIRPEKKREKEQKALLASMSVGDTVLTTSGFYGVVIDITNDTVIVEFGNNKNCRIPMQKSAIVQLEHPEGYVPPVDENPAPETKKGLFSGLRKKDSEKTEKESIRKKD